MNSKNKLTFSKVVERFSYGCGDFGCNIYTAMSAFLLFYYTDYAKVSALAVGTIMMVSRIFDGISDIIMGVIVDRTKSRFGKARPWLLRMCIPFAISGILLFSVPTSWAATPKLVYVFITYNLVSTVIYTAINVPYSALNALMTQDPYERSVLSIFRNLLATAGTLLNQKFTPDVVAGEKGLENMASLIRSYFAMDGHHVQFNVIDRQTLIEAQKHPDDYRDLIVRVAGYSDFFRNLSKPLQDEIINRTEQSFE